MNALCDALLSDLSQLRDHHIYGSVTSFRGMLVEISGIERGLTVGGRCYIISKTGRKIPCEAVGFYDKNVLAMPFQGIEGISFGCRVEIGEDDSAIYPSTGWLGRVVNSFGSPVDGKGGLPKGSQPYPLRNTPPPAHSRQRVAGKMDLGIRSINTFTPCCRGQRIGIFSGSGVGKSSLLSMLARNTASDVNVIGLIGERGREVQEFIQDNLGAEGLARSVVVVATSDESPLARRQAAYLTLSVAEYFRDRGQHCLCLIDSVTRFAMAQREIGLSVGEPPTTRGFTPSVFSELPRLLERAGPGINQGSITGLFTALVEGDDHNEPISDALRATLDGHIVLDRSIAERGRYPAINVLRSLSRAVPDCNSAEENDLVNEARRLISVYEDMAEMIRLGAYRTGSDPSVDEAIARYPHIEAFLAQDKDETTNLDQGHAMLSHILKGEQQPPISQNAPPADR